MANSVGVRFTTDGPLFPVELLQSVEAGELVIFSGAGVSRQGGLPDFSGLVTAVCERLGRPMETDEQELFDAKAFDAALGLIESKVGKPRLRSGICEVLALKAESNFATHHALLQLAASKEGHLRLVTTNFDRAFELSSFSRKPVFEYAPYLPLPGNSWNSVVHLHGGLGNARDLTKEFLVFTSVDFGRAYITKGWASRFLTELFRRARMILFIGYSISDPATRYVVDAFAADRASGRSHVAKPFLLKRVNGDQAAQQERTWRSRGIEPITYDPMDHHRLLHETIQNCAKMYRAGFFDRDSIVLQYGSQSPVGDPEQLAISQLTWALQDESGHAARRFAGINPAPSLEWLEILDQAGLFKLPTQAQRALPAVGLFAASDFTLPLNPVTQALCRWLCSHLGSPQLLQWIIKAGCHLHPSFAALIRQRLAGDDGSGPLPTGARLIWAFLSAQGNRVYTRTVADEVLLHLNTLEEEKWGPLLRDLVLSWLAPTLRFNAPFSLGKEADLESVDAHSDIELIPAAGEDSWELARRLSNRPDANNVAKELLGRLTENLRSGLTYLQFLEQVTSESDRSFLDRPSIDEHSQNTQFRPWTVYVQLLRESWERVSGTDVARAREEVDRWSRIEFPLFRRFVLWSAGKLGGLSVPESVEFLSKQPPSCLWGLDTYRELLQYLGRIASELTWDCARHLVAHILEGPPRRLYRTETSAEEFSEIRERTIYLRLAKLRNAGLVLPEDAQKTMSQIIGVHADWDHPITEREEFLSWIGPARAAAPYDFERQLDDYVHWTDAQVASDVGENSADPDVVARWAGLLAADSQRAVTLLEAFGRLGLFNSKIWAISLDLLNNERTRADCVRLFGRFGLAKRDFVSAHIQQLASLVNLYFHETKGVPDELFWSLWDLLLGFATEVVPAPATDPVFAAMNSPIGNFTEALLGAIGEANPKTFQEIPATMQERLEGLLRGHSQAIPWRESCWPRPRLGSIR